MEYVRTEVINDKYTDDENSDVLSEFQGSVLWTKRSLLYRWSFMSLPFLFALFLLGFSSPFWMTKHQVDKYRGYYNIREKVDVSIGLWRVCEGTSFSDITDCTDIPDITHYIVVCQTLLCLCLIFTVFSLIFGMYENCATRYDVDEGSEVRTKRPEINAVSAGTFGLAGVSVYGTSIIEAIRNGEGAVHWAFLVTTASVIGMIVCGILMAITNPVHSPTHSFPPGQSMNLSRQNSLKVCEPAVQNRLVHSADSLGQASGSQASGTTYGGTGSSYDIKEVQFLQRSQSCLGSYKSSMNVSPTLSLNRSESQTNTYIIESRDIHTKGHKSSRKPDNKLYNKKVHKRSKRFVDSKGGNNIVNLMNNSNGDDLSTAFKAVSKTEGVKSCASLLCDSLPPPGNSKGTLIGQTQESAVNEDLMVLDDPLEETSPAQKPRIKIEPKAVCVVTKNTNVVMENDTTASSQILSDLQRSTVSSGSWENQPWPDPPTENETQDMPVQTINKSAVSDCLPAKTTETQMKNITESHQFQSNTKKHVLSDDSNISYKVLKSNESNIKSNKGRQSKDDRASYDKNSVYLYKVLVPVRKEYDNPLFESQLQDRDQSESMRDIFSNQICELTATVLPSYKQSSLPNYYTATNTMQSEFKLHKAGMNNMSCSKSEEPGCRFEGSPHLSNGQINEIHSTTYNRFGKNTTQNTTKKIIEAKDNAKSSDTQQQHQSMKAKSRTRKMMRGQQQIGSEHLDSELMQQRKLLSLAGEGSESQLVCKLPRFAVRKKDISDIPNGLEYDYVVPKGKARTDVIHKQKSYGSNMDINYYGANNVRYHDYMDSGI